MEFGGPVEKEEENSVVSAKLTNLWWCCWNFEPKVNNQIMEVNHCIFKTIVVFLCSLKVLYHSTERLWTKE